MPALFEGAPVAHASSVALSSAEAAFCPLCGRRADAVLLELNCKLEPKIVRLLRAKYPQWNQHRGACPRCILDAVAASHQPRRAESVQHESQLPYLIYSSDAHTSAGETALLPTPYRMQAYPQFTGRGVVMAFLDSGFYPHPDLTQPYNRILAHIDATVKTPVERPNFRRPALTSWHGTMTSCVAAGNGFLSDYRYRGMASDAQLVLVKTGNRRGRRIHEEDIYRALNWVIHNQHRYNIRIVNLSVGGDIPSDGTLSALDELVEEASARGMVVVCAIGNDNAERVVPPASAPSAITVGGLDDRNSLDRARHRLYHSNYGRGGRFAPKPDVIAPALWVPAPMLPQTRVYNEGQYLWKLAHAPDDELKKLLRARAAENTFKKETLHLPLDEIRRVIRQRMIEQKYIHAYYQHADGTSMAAPLVSAVAAQMLEAHPTLAPAQIAGILKETARPLEHAPRAQQGCGVLNAAHAVAHALRAENGVMQHLPLSPQINEDAMTFYYYDVKAKHVAVVGDWNGWKLRSEYERHRLREHAPGVWKTTLPRPKRGT
ncbi:MAG: S8 family serine peptidase, partial [Chloroflexi bacterium]|nr:S8 family serine peptidase [Chloroflexota bacterium]